MKGLCKPITSMVRNLRSTPISNAIRNLNVFTVGLIMLFLYGCNSTAPVPLDLTNFPTTNPAQSKDYQIQPGDELSIKFYFNSELNEENLVVRPDGNISLQLVHEVKAAGRTPMELKEILTNKYATHLNKPEIAVIVRTVKAPVKIYVGGEVKQPGEFEMVHSMTALQAIALARGLKPTANESNVLLIRRTEDNKPSTIRLDLEAAFAGEDLSHDIALHPYDYIYVPTSFW